LFSDQQCISCLFFDFFSSSQGVSAEIFLISCYIQQVLDEPSVLKKDVMKLLCSECWLNASWMSWLRLYQVIYLPLDLSARYIYMPSMRK